MAAEILNSILSKIGEYLVEATIRQVGYLVHFKSNIEDLMKEDENLRLAHERVKSDVERAIRNTEEIEGDVQKWLTDVSGVTEDVQKLEEEIQANKTCLNGWCPNWGWRYRLSKKAKKKTNVMLKLQDSGKLFSRVSHPVTPPGIPPKDFMPSESTNYAFDEIIKALKDDKTSIVGLYGMGGVGKTTLAKLVAKKVKEEKIFDEVVMAVVSQTPILEKIQDQIAELLGLKLKEKSEERRASRLTLRLKNEKKILIILDDVWAKLDLTTIGIPFGDDHKGCKIFLTTRRLHVCVAMGCQAQIPLNVLNEEEGLTLLKRHAGVGDNSPTLNDMAIEVARECKGLPLAIVVIGSALKGKDIEEWSVVSKKLKNAKAVDIEDADKDIYVCLKLSYDYLKSEKIKFCFLLCSLYPEDYEIDLEELFRSGTGLGLYPDADSIEEARSEFRIMINQLKSSCLLLDGNTEECVKMHDIVRDVALWITSHGNNVFMVKAGMRLTEWPKMDGLEHCTAISLMVNDIQVLPSDLFCPKLEILLTEGASFHPEVSDEFFKEMKGLKVLSLNCWDLSLRSLEFLTNLVTLELGNCKLSDISSLGKLKRLEILSFRGCYLDKLSKEVGELGKLRLLYLRECHRLKRIRSNLIRRCSQLEELYIIDSFNEWEVEETSAEGSNASLFELNSLSRLARLHLRTDSECLPKNLFFPKLRSYVICVNTGYDQTYPRALKISNIEATSLVTFQALYRNLEYLYLKNTVGCQNILPSIDQSGLNELKSLVLEDCSDLRCIIDTSRKHAPANELSNLMELFLKRLIHLKEICCGARLSKGLLEKLEIIKVTECPDMCSLFPTVLIRRLRKLKEVEISYCEKLEEVFQLEGLCHAGEEKHVVLSSLTELSLENLPQLTCIWKGPTNYLILQNLKSLSIDGCTKMEYIFPISIAPTLVKLEALSIADAYQLKQVFYMDDGSEEYIVARDGKNIMFPKLKILTLGELVNLVSFYPQNYHSTWPALEEFKIYNCSNLGASFIVEVNMQDLRENLRVLEVMCCNQELCDGILVCLSHDFKSLEEIRIENCEIKVVFELERLVRVTNGQQRQFSLPNLKELRLIDLEELENLYTGPTHLLSLQNLTLLNFIGCRKLRHILSATLAESLLQLKELYVYDCGELEEIIVEDDEEDHLQPLLFPNLEQISVGRCNQLKRVFPIIIGRGLQQLKKIYLEDNSQLEEVFGHRLTDGGDVTDDKEIVLPQLQKLYLRALPSFTNFCPADYHFILKLETLSMEGFDEDHRVWAEIFTHVKEVEELYIHNCGVKELKGLCKTPPHILSLQNLTLLQFDRCSKLRHILSTTLAQSLLQLKRLDVYDCGELEEIIVEDDEEDHLQPLLFPNLEQIWVKRCNKLKRVFPIIIARGLQQLNYIRVQDNSQLEEVFGHRVRDGADVMDDKEIVLLQLQYLTLEYLPSLTNFCPVGYHFIFPSLKDGGTLHVRGCRKVTTRFSWDEKERSVHGEGKPPKYDEEEVPTMDIECYGYEHFQERLPRYMENLNEEQKGIK